MRQKLAKGPDALLWFAKDVRFPGAFSIFGAKRQATAEVLPALRREASEAISTLREVAAWPKDLATILPKRTRTEKAEQRVVVFVHGFMATAGVFRPLRRHLERELGCEAASFSYAPGVSVSSIAQSLSDLVSEIPVGATVSLIGHSLGGIAARYYVQELAGHTRIAQTISLGSPFSGTTLASPFPFLVGRDLGPQSALLERLRERAHVAEVPHLSVAAGRDRVILPQSSASFVFGETIEFADLGHNGLLYDKRVHDAITTRLQGA
jgi:pimeloyl-ACP methyl ester carboxylesterase